MAQTTDQPAIYPDVLTLAEAAAYLRVSEAEIIELMRRQSLPAQGRRAVAIFQSRDSRVAAVAGKRELLVEAIRGTQGRSEP